MTQVIAVTGASGSGKSTLAEQFVAHCNAVGERSAALLSVDAYYRDLSHLSFEARDALNFDHPDAIEFELFAEHVAALSAGQAIHMPIYDFSIHSRAPGGIEIRPVDILVLEGLLLAAWPELSTHVQHLVFVETELEVCLARRIARDTETRGRSEASVRAFWETRALPMFLQFGAPAQSQAHLVVSGERPVDHSIEQMLTLLED